MYYYIISRIGVVSVTVESDRGDPFVPADDYIFSGRHSISTKCWCIVGPPSSMLGRQCVGVGVCWDEYYIIIY